MTLDIRWLAPCAIVLAGQPCFAARYLSEDQARALIFQQADEFAPAAVTLSPEQVQQIEKLSGVKVRVPQQQVWAVRERGKFAGWLVQDEVIGKRDLITYMAGINPDGTLRNFQIVEYRESVGWQVKDLRWRDQFVGKKAGDPVELGVDIANISGATLSCRHVTEGLKRLLALHQVVLHGRTP